MPRPLSQERERKFLAPRTAVRRHNEPPIPYLDILIAVTLGEPAPENEPPSHAEYRHRLMVEVAEIHARGHEVTW